MTNKEVVYLVNAQNDPGMAALSNEASFPALGVLALGSWLKNRVPNVEVVCRDGEVHSHEKVIDDIYNLAPAIVGVSVLGTSYQNALEIAETAKCFGATTVFGNDQASQLSRKILKNRPYVDYVIGSEYGEESLELLVRRELGEDIPLESIPHLTWSDGSVKGFDFSKDSGNLSIMNSALNPSGKRRNSLDAFPVIDRTLYPQDHWDSYLKNYLAKFSGLHKTPVTGVSTMNRARGCSRSKDSTKCKHCDMFLDPAFSSPEKFWEEARAAYEQVGANVLYEVCDSLSSFPDFVKGVVKTKPGDLGFDPQFFVYAQALDLVRNPEMVQYFKDMGVFRANVGLESGSNPTLQHMKGRHDSVETNYSALRMLKDAGIHVYGSLVLGTEPETPRTLRETVNWAKKIIDEGLVADIEAQPILPLPNNYYGRQLYQAGLFPGGNDWDWPVDTDSVSKIYIDRFSGIRYDQAIEAAKEIREHAKAAGINFGSGVSREEKYK